MIDANILFAALIKKSTTADLLAIEDFKLYAPEFLFDEFKKYEQVLLKKTNRSSKDFKEFFSFLKRKIKTIPQEQIIPFLKKAENLSPDPKDTVYLALALALKANIWSNDKHLKERQTQVPILTTAEIKKKLESTK